MKGLLASLVVLAVVVGGGACGDAEPTDVPTEAGTPSYETPSMVPETPTMVPASPADEDPTQTEPSPETYATVPSTGNAMIDTSITTLLSRPVTRWDELLSYTPFACSRDFGQGLAPICLSGEAVGTTVEAIPVAGCPEATFHRRESIDAVLTAWAQRDIEGLFAVFHGAGGSQPLPLPSTPYAVVFVISDSLGNEYLTAFLDGAGQVVAISGSCDVMFDPPGSEGRQALLPPLGR